MSENDIEIRGVSKSYGETRVLSSVTINVPHGSFSTLLGPSGCGKTTLLRAVAGFVEPDEGEVIIRGKRMNGIPPNKRRTALVFQNYALFPHMTVYDNVAYPLKLRKKSQVDISKKVRQGLELVGLAGYEKRFPKELSGGQQQRVALARAIVWEPYILLLDEPFSNLDYVLRKKMRLEMRKIQRELGITTILVTHDQEEAFTLSDQVYVMNHGRVVQQGDPYSIYNSPATEFVGEFIGESNVFGGVVTSIYGDNVVVQTEDGFKVVALRPALDLHEGSKVSLIVRAENVLIDDAETPYPNSYTAIVEMVSYLGHATKLVCRVNDTTIVSISSKKGALPPVGKQINLSWDPESVVVLSDVK
ncbi:MAG: ABC transporter ATP-binding protein [Nitrososphaerota archaeon]|nr:ABC transporter ATP-binding protein [Nitrososphaerota archaeon]